MKFLNVFVAALQVLPNVITSVERMLGARKGKEKRDAVLDTFGLSVGIAEAVAQKDIVDQEAFTQAIKDINDGIVKALNASVWHKSKQ